MTDMIHVMKVKNGEKTKKEVWSKGAVTSFHLIQEANIHSVSLTHAITFHPFILKQLTAASWKNSSTYCSSGSTDS